MGITGLLPFLEKATKPCHISEFRGATVVIDTYCWLHKAASACSIPLIQEQSTQGYINYCLRYVKMLQSYEIRPILVFDGKNLPAKSKTEAKRRDARKKAKQRAAELLSLGKIEEAQGYLRQAVNITPQIASAVIKECQKINVDCIVAPYESDAQLAYFNIKGIAEVVITEDSDLVLFGCTKIVYKLDIQGRGYLVEADKIAQAMKMRPDKYTFDKFRYMCILSGCDYVDSLPGIGLKKALKFIMLTEESNPEIFLDRVPRYLKMHHLKVTNEYKENFMLADATFRHQIVFDPLSKKLMPLQDPQGCGTNPEYCKNAGETYDNEKALQVALGNLHPVTFEKLNDWCPSQVQSSTNSIWSGIYKKSVSRKVQKSQLSVMKTFFSKKNEVTSDAENLQLQDVEDDQLKKELEIYSRKSTDNQESAEEIAPENDVQEKETVTSPVLTKNPFIRRFSKFHSTNIVSNIVVKSRFFASQDEVFNPTTETVEATGCLDVDTKIPKSYVGTNNEDNSDDAGSKTIHITNIDKTDIVAVSDEENSDVNMIPDREKTTNSSQPSKSPIENTSKRKKLGMCRSVGLKKPRPETQPTISSYFNKLHKM